jgi:hypothetical protein
MTSPISHLQPSSGSEGPQSGLNRLFAQMENGSGKPKLSACARDYPTGNRFSKGTTTIDGILGGEYLLIHELVEISEIKRWEGTFTEA